MMTIAAEDNDLLDNMIRALCTFAAKYIQLEEHGFEQKKWIRIGTKRQISTEIDHRRSINGAIGNGAITNSTPYLQLESWLTNHPVLSSADTQIGAYGKIDSLIDRILMCSISINKKKRVLLDPSAGTLFVRQMEQLLMASDVQYEAQARILGLKLSTRRIELEPNITLVRLNEREINIRQPYIETLSVLRQTVNDRALLGQDSELQMRLSIPVNRDTNLAIMNTQNDASDRAYETAQDVLSALQLSKSGAMEIGPIQIYSFIMNGSLGIYSFTNPITTMGLQTTFGSSDVKHLQKSYRIITQDQVEDNVLNQIIRRFLLVRQRQDEADRLVDFVIAWESMLLTIIKDTGVKGELSYRFSINGAGVLYMCNIERNRINGQKFMKGLYDLRSSIVHGSTVDTIPKDLKTLQSFNNLSELNKVIEDRLRIAIFWLSSLDEQSRPYHKKDGWEELLWASGAIRTN